MVLVHIYVYIYIYLIGMFLNLMMLKSEVALKTSNYFQSVYFQLFAP